MAPKLYDGKAVCEASENEWVTWNAGVTDKIFVKSALAPSNMWFVRCVAVFHSPSATSKEQGETRA